MRDQEIMRLYSKTNQRVALLVEQFQFLMTRIEAIGQVIGKDKKDEIDKLHMELLTKHKQEMAAVAEKIKEEALKPQLILAH